MKSYDFHPEAETDLDAIWEYIAIEHPAAADRVIDGIEAAIDASFRFLTWVIAVPI